MQIQHQALLRQTAQALLPVSGVDAAFEARELLNTALGGAAAYYTEEELTAQQQAWLNNALARRMKREPLQYILEEWAFMGLPIRVTPEALIPRQDTETLAEAALALAKQRGSRTALDICCGTGCVGIALAKLGGLSVTASDISDGCVRLANENALRNQVMLQTRCGDLFELITGRYDIIVCNPPYLSAGDMQSLQPELKFEPALALYGGEDGLDFYRRLKAESAAYLNDGGALLMEVGIGQAADVLRLFGGGRMQHDINGIARVVIVERQEMER